MSDERKDDGGPAVVWLVTGERVLVDRADWLAYMEPRHCPTCRHHEVDDKGDHWCALGISTAGRVPGLVTHLQPFGCSKHEKKETSDDE